MRRIQTGQAQVQTNIDTSNKLLKGMTSFMGWRAWGTKADKTKPQFVNHGGLGGDAEGSAAETQQRAGGGARVAAGRSAGAGADNPFSGGGGGGGGEEPDAFDQISAMMSEMHQQALAMNAELKAQDPLLDNLVDTAHKHNSDVYKATKATASVGGRKAKAVAKEGAGISSVDGALKAAGVGRTGRMAALKAMQS
jgi:hypothetical protein